MSQDKLKEHLLLLFERPLEPLFVPKGKDQTVFDLPKEYYTDRYKPLQTNLAEKFGFESRTRISLKKIDISKLSPSLEVPLSLGRQENFSLFIPWHREMSGALIDVFMNQPTLEHFLSVSAYVRERANPFLYIYALSVAILHRPDTRGMSIPSLAEVFPEKFVDSQIFTKAREESNLVPDGSRLELIIPRDYTASDLEEEHRLAYFREDLGVNLHHWHWHLVYPSRGPISVVNKDRRGELFYYMHQQLMARYNFERFSNYLARTKRLLNLREPIAEGYFPKLDSLVSSRVWPSRHSNTALSDVNREVDQIQFDLADMERWRDRFYQAIHTGFVTLRDGKTQTLDESGGIDILGNMMEASILSVNQNLYGDLHNFGHIAIAMAHDPDSRHLETYGVMGDQATAMRDPAFYRWHAFIDDIFQEYKNLLLPYSTQQLGFSEVRVESAEINVQNYQKKNELMTMWKTSKVDLSRGMDFTPRGNVFARFTHLQHLPFTYKIQVQNGGQRRKGTCRIFMAPKKDERGIPFLFKDQRHLFIEMDKWIVDLNPGKNEIVRRSKDSSVVIPFEQIFRDLEENRPTDTNQLLKFNFCGCGWPEHMLVPKGTAAGLESQLFVMISDYEADKPLPKQNETANQSRAPGAVTNGSSYCGLRDKQYPDRRHMGYPFDRRPRTGVSKLSEFLTPNMTVIDVSIRHQDKTIGEKPSSG